MAKNDFCMNTRKKERRVFSQKTAVLLSFSIFLTGIVSLAGIYFFVRSVMEKTWNTTGMYAFAWKTLIYFIFFCCFVSMVKIALEEKPFSKTLTYCIWIIGGMFLAASFVFPRLEGYHSSGFELFSSGSFVLIDGMFLLPGLLFIILGSLIKAGFEMQREMDEIL